MAISRTSALLRLHFSAILFGSTALFGEAVQAGPIAIVFGRTVFAVLALSLVAAWGRNPPWKGLADKGIAALCVLGAMLALHWVTFFMAVQYGGVALATLGFASFPVFVALLEAVILRARPPARDVLVLLLVTAGMALITPRFSLADTGTAGLLWGILSGAIYAGIAVFNRYRAPAATSAQSCWWQCLAACIVIAPFSPAAMAGLDARDWLLLALLGAVCTGLAYTIFLQALDVVKAQTVAVVISMEPVYAIALAWLAFNAVPGPQVVLGGALIIGAVLLASLQPARQHT
ncbi:DMT family transporter [Pseudoduganella ginsengisoli]|nr:DMT family transporter [Pseudoduganella ginsengisoli]